MINIPCPKCGNDTIFDQIVGTSNKDNYWFIICQNENCLLMSASKNKKSCYENWKNNIYYIKDGR